MFDSAEFSLFLGPISRARLKRLRASSSVRILSCGSPPFLFMQLPLRADFGTPAILGRVVKLLAGNPIDGERIDLIEVTFATKRRVFRRDVLKNPAPITDQSCL